MLSISYQTSLTLSESDIWTPSIDPEAKPVMVWFHGEVFRRLFHSFVSKGLEMSHNYDVVIVTINHRLNMLETLDPL